MIEFISHLNHLIHFDGILHWCFIIAVIGFCVSVVWGFVRVFIPLRYLAKQSAGILHGQFPVFDTPVSGIREIQQLRHLLHYMMEQINTAREREIAYRNALTETQENERLRIAQEIHDDTIQSLVLVAHNLERTAQAMPLSDDATAEHLKNARSQLVATIDRLRQMIANLRPTVLDELGLVIAIQSLCEEYPVLEFKVKGEICAINHTQELALFRAAQEAIHNAKRHAQAQKITVVLTYTDTAVTLEVLDNGVGFELPKHFQEFATQGHYGLLGIQERILCLGGRLTVISAVYSGTSLIVMLPILHRTTMAA